MYIDTVFWVKGKDQPNVKKIESMNSYRVFPEVYVQNLQLVYSLAN